MAHRNNVTIEGNITNDASIEMVGRDKKDKVTNFCIANHNYIKDSSGDMIKETHFIDIKAWGREAEKAFMFGKRGKFVQVTGRLFQSKWTDKKGFNRSKLMVLADNLFFSNDSKYDSSPDETNALSTEDEDNRYNK